MKLLNYRDGGRPRLGAALGDWVVDLRRVGRAAGLPRSLPTDVDGLLAAGPLALQAARQAVEWASVRLDAGKPMPGLAQPASRVNWLPPVLRPGKLVCVGLNYPPLSLQGYQPPAYPVLFHKVATSLAAHRTPIRMPRVSRKLEYEGELAVVIGRAGKHIPQQEALDHVAGYTIANDVGAPDLQQRTSQWTSGKMLDTFCPLGPCLTTREDVPEPANLRILTRLNGHAVQDGSTREMVFSVSYLVSYISSLVTLQPGDLILTGSPKRNGEQPDPRLLLKTGDVVRIEIERLGVLENSVSEED